MTVPMPCLGSEDTLAEQDGGRRKQWTRYPKTPTWRQTSTRNPWCRLPRLQPTLRQYREQIEHERYLPPALVEQLHAAGFYRMVIPRSLGGLQGRSSDLSARRGAAVRGAPARSDGTSATTASASLSRSELPDEGSVPRNLPAGARHRDRRHRRAGGRTGVPVEGGYRVSGHWTFGSASCQEAVWMLGSFQILDEGEPRRRPDGGSLYWRGVFPPRGREDRAGKLGRGRAARDRQLSTGR